MNSTERIDLNATPAQTGPQATERVADTKVVSAQPAISAATERLAAPVITTGTPTSAIGIGVGTSVTLGAITYQIRQLLARSGEAEVYLMELQQQKLVWKLYHQDFKPKQEIVDSLKRMKHANIMALFDTGEYNGRFYELNEYLAGGTLDDLKPLTNVDRLKDVVRQVNEALNLCHQHRIIHRDIKPQNIFFRDAARTQVVLGDFGISSQLDAGASSRVTTRARTSLYAAPELFTEIKGKTTLGIEVDYYALGVTVLEVWDGQNPFGTDLEHNMMRAKTGGRFLMPGGMPASFNSLVKGLLTPNYEDRWSYAQVVAWCRGEPNIPLKFAALFEYKPYLVGKRHGLATASAIDSPEAMGVFLEKHKTIGIEELYGHKISQWLYGAGDSEKASQITDVVEKDYPKDKEAGLKEAVFILNPESPLLGYDGVTRLETFAEMATYFEQHAVHYQKALQLFTNDFYAYLMALDVITDEDPATGETATTDYKAKARKFHALFQDRKYTPAKALNTIILDLQNGELKLGNTQTRFEHLEEFVTVANSDFQQYVVEQFVDTNSKVNVWLETYHPAVAQKVLHWREAKRHITSTLGYALGVYGYRIGGQEVNNAKAFQQLLAKQITLFFTDPNTAHNREEADYWLKNHHNSSLAQELLEATKQQQIASEYLNRNVLYLLDRHSEIAAAPYAAAEAVLQAAERTFSPNQQALSSELTPLLTDFYANQISDAPTPKKAATHLDLYQPLVHHLINLPDAYQPITRAIMNHLNDTIEAGVQHDLTNLQKSDKHFWSYYNNVDQFIGQQLSKHFPEMPLLGNWQKRQQLLTAKTSSLVAKLQAEKQNKLAENEKTFAPVFVKAKKQVQAEVEEVLASGAHNGDVMRFYRSKGVNFFLAMTVLTLIGYVGFVFLALVVWEYLPVVIKPTYLIRKAGRWFYKPIVLGMVESIIDNKIDSPYKKTMDGYNANVNQIESHFTAQEKQETFEAKRAVFLMNPQQL